MIVASCWCYLLKSLPFIAVMIVSSCLLFGVPEPDFTYCLSKIIHHPLEATSSIFFVEQFVSYTWGSTSCRCLCFCRCFSHPLVEQDVLQESLHPYAAWKTSGGYLYRPIGWLDHFLILADASRWIVLAPPNGLLYNMLYVFTRSIQYCCFAVVTIIVDCFTSSCTIDMACS